MRGTVLVGGLLVAAAAVAAVAGEPVTFHSPGFPPSSMDAQGRLVEDWAAVSAKLSGEGVTDGPAKVEVVKLDGVIPAARAASNRGAVRLISTAYRAPAFPAGVDVLSFRVEEARGQTAKITLAIDLPEKARVGLRSVSLGTRTVLSLLPEAIREREVREWGYYDDAASMPGWAKPEGKCDPAFRNIRAGMGGVPIIYRFSVAPGSAATVVLGFCESHWAEPEKRPLMCRVEGAPQQKVDPVAKWGRHKPGVLAFRARDENGDGKLQIAVLPVPGAEDQNSILNAIWIFPPGPAPNLARVVSGELSAKAIRYVQVGGEKDQSIFLPGKLEYPMTLPAGGAKELTLLVACHGGSAPIPEPTAWTTDTLRHAARAVWCDWPKP
jgi:hypothetical protein